MQGSQPRRQHSSWCGRDGGAGKRAAEVTPRHLAALIASGQPCRVCRRPARRSLQGKNVSAPESGSRERPSWADGAPRVACAGLEPVSAKLKGRGQLTPALRAIEAQDRAGAAERLRKV